MSPTFDEIVRAWILFYDDRLPKERKDRIKAFITLLINLEKHSYTKEDLNLSKKERIVRACVNPFYKNAKLKPWMALNMDLLEKAIDLHYPVMEIEEAILTPEQDAKLDNMKRRAEETKALRTADNSESEYNDGTIDLAQSLPNMGDEIELTQEMLDAMDGPDVVYDEDFEKKLGLK
jgi:hypothetical protein